VQAEGAGEGSSVEIRNPVITGSDIFEGSPAIEIGHGGCDQVACLRNLQNALIELALLFGLQAEPSGDRIYVYEIGIETLQRIEVAGDITAQGLVVFVEMSFVFFRIFLLFIFFELRFGKYGVEGRSVLELISVQEFRNVDDIVGRKFFEEIGSGQIDAMMRFHPVLQLRGDRKPSDEMIDINEAACVCDLFANVGEASRKQVEGHTANRFRLRFRWPNGNAEVDAGGRRGLSRRRRGTHAQRYSENGRCTKDSQNSHAAMLTGEMQSARALKIARAPKSDWWC